MFNTFPTRFRHYEVLKLLGGGGFGVVYLARDTDLKRLVVLKTLHPHLAAQPDMVRRFVQEARAMARLDHANIVRVYRVQNDPQMPFFEMEYVKGQTLANYRGSRVLTLQEAMPLLKQMAAALDAAHRQGIVHRDVKPDNVLIKPDGQLKLTDFGIIKLLEATGTVHPSTGGIIGTPSYIAPEQADLSRKHEIGPATDIYALGVVAYELSTGQLPFFGGPSVAILYAHAHTPPPDPRTFNSYLPATVANVLLKVLAKQPAQRYPSAMSFVQALEPPAWSSTPTDPAVSVSGGTTRATPVTPIPLVTPPIVLQTPPDTPTSQPAISKPMMVGFVVVVLVAMIVGGVLRELFSTSPGPEPGIAQATLTLSDTMVEPEPAPATPEPAPLTATSMPSVPPTATPAPPTAAPSLGIGSTMEGQDSMTLLYVPEGEFLRGSEEDEPDEKPQRSIYLDAFWIDKTEVTNEMYAACVNGGECRPPEANGSFTRNSYYDNPEYNNYPVIEISWEDARTYCEWTGRRLPTEAEWEKAARGTEGQTYPWGDQSPSEDLLNFSFNVGDTTEVGSYLAGASPYGALDMAGNVWEWTADWYDADYYKDAPERNPQGPDTGGSRVLRGASWSNAARWVRAGIRGRNAPADRYDLAVFVAPARPHSVI